MCDAKTDKDIDEYLMRTKGITRRAFSRMSAAMGLALTLPSVANAQQITEQDIEITTPDGVADCYFVHPANGKAPGVIMWPDIFGLRDAFKIMGKRLAESGYSVLVINPFYRSGRAPIPEAGVSFAEEEGRNTILALAGTLTSRTHMTDARAFVSFLDAQPAVDTSRKIGTAGYCMGGPMVLNTAAAVPERIGAAATFHGASLATDEGDSPHLLIPTMKAQFLIAIAENDDASEPEVKSILRKSFADAGHTAEIEVYEGTLHGWCPPGGGAYNEAQAEKAWSRLLALFENALV